MEQDEEIKLGDIVKMVDFGDLEGWDVYKDRIGECLRRSYNYLTVRFMNNPALMQYYSACYNRPIEGFSESMMDETFYDFRFVKVK